MSYIHFKSVCNQNFDKVTFDGVNLTLSQLKKLIFEKAKYNKNLNYDLEITNADSNEIYKNENDLIQKNSRVLVRRVMKNPTGPLRAQQSKSVTTPQSTLSANRVAPPPLKQEPAVSVVATPVAVPAQIADVKPVAVVDVKPAVVHAMPEIRMETLKKTEIMQQSDVMIKPFVEQPKQPLNGKMQTRPVPPNYICGHCKQPGHFKQFCPNVAAGLVTKEENRPKYPTGIPRSYMITVTEGAPGAMLGPEGYVIPKIDHNALKVVKKDKTPFLTEEEEEELKKGDHQQDESSKVNTYLPDELTCPFEEHGKHIIKDAVLVPCCGHFICCDECIKEKISREEIVECPNKSCGNEIASLESITSHHQMRKMVNEYLNDVKLNKINNKTANSNSSGASLSTSNSDAFIDSLLEFEFNTKPAAPMAVVDKNPAAAASPTAISETEKKKEEGEELLIEKDLLYNKDDDEDESAPTAGKSPVQDSNISSTIALANKIDASGALLPTPPISQLLGQQPPTALGNNPIQRIGTVAKPATVVAPVTTQYEGYPYMMQQAGRPSLVPPPVPVMNQTTAMKPQLIPQNQMRRLPNNIPIQTHPVQIRQTAPMGYGNGMMIGAAYDMQSSGSYYNYGNGYPPTTISHMYPQIHSYSNSMAPSGYPPQAGGYGLHSNNMIHPGMGMQKKLTEQEFYDMKDRLRRGHNSDLHSFASDMKKRRSISRSLSRSRTRSRGRRSRSNSYSSGSSNYNSRRRHRDTYRHAGGRLRRSNSKTYKRRSSYSRSRSSSRSNSSYNKRRLRRTRSRSRVRQEKPLVADQQQVNGHDRVQLTKSSELTTHKTSGSDKPPLSSRAAERPSKPKNRSRSRSIPRISSKVEKSRSNSKSKQVVNEKLSDAVVVKDKEKKPEARKHRSRSKSVERDTRKKTKSNETEPIVKSVVVNKPAPSETSTVKKSTSLKSTATLIPVENKAQKVASEKKRKSETAELDKDLDEHRKKSKKENNADEISKKAPKKDKKEKEATEMGNENASKSDKDKKSKHKKSKKKHKHKHSERSVSKE